MLKLSDRKKRTAAERVYRTRMSNVRMIARGYKSQAELARVLGFSPAFVTHIAGESPIKVIGEKLARDIEAKLGLYFGWLDTPH